MKKKVLILILFLILFGIIYNIIDNKRFIIVEKEIKVEHLPTKFNNLKILQISDLHGKYFGDNQEALLEAINNTDYDILVFTGDMNSGSENTLDESKAIFTLIDGISNKENVFWVDGNAGPYASKGGSLGTVSYGISDIGYELEKMNVKILIKPYKYEKENEYIWITPEVSSSIISMNTELCENLKDDTTEYNMVKQYISQMEKWYDNLNNNGECKILLNHYPFQTNISENEWNSLGELDYNLIISGHHHGGQFRIPFYGALYIQDPASGVFGGCFPNQSDVKGLNYVCTIPQYISAGLGASSSIKFLNFRLFNTPEINLLILKSL